MSAVVERYHVPPSQCWEGSRGAARGNVHLHIVEDVTLGRLKRRAGECLCSKRRGNYERPLEPGERNFLWRCERCFAVAKQHDLQLHLVAPKSAPVSAADPSPHKEMRQSVG